jgi:phosphatidylinositol alpha-mannosyltransferase
MRVALVCGYDLSVPGGVQGQVGSIARVLVRLGDTVAVISPLTGALPDTTADGFRLYRCGSSVRLPANGSLAPVAPTPAAALATRRALRDFAPDVLHVHEPLVPGPPLASLLIGAPGHRGSLPVVATFHRADSDPLYRAAGRLLGSVVGRRITLATGVSAAAIATARSVVGDHLPSVVEVGNGVEVGRFERARSARVEHRARLPYKNGDRPLVGFVGRLEQRKGVSLLLDAVAALDRDVDVAIAGEGREGANQRERAAGDPRVTFVGRLGDEALEEFVASVDVLVAPALGGESFGMVLLEAMAAGTCVVASDIPGYRLAAAGAAVHFRSGDAGDLARALRLVLADATLRAEHVALGLDRARQCSIETVVATYRSIYESAVASS